MLITDLRRIGNNLLAARKQRGMTQAEVAEAAGLSDRTYADIERGTANMRIETFLQICGALHVTPNDLLVEAPAEDAEDAEALLDRLQGCLGRERTTALRLLSVYLHSLD